MSDPIGPRPSVIIERHENRRIFKWLALLGIILLIIEIGQSYIPGHKIVGLRLIVEAIIGFVGFYGIDPREMREAGTLVYTWGSGLIKILRFGKRATDNSDTAVITSIDTRQDPPMVTTSVQKVPLAGHSPNEDLSHD